MQHIPSAFIIDMTDKLGSGSFGEVYAVSMAKNPKKLAAKMEKIPCQHPQLLYEYKIYQKLQNDPCKIGVPNAYAYGKYNDKYNALIMDRLGPSLQDLGILDMNYVLIIGIQLFERIRYIHHKGFVHRDLKPQNIMLGSPDDPENASKIYIIDYGLAKKFIIHKFNMSTHLKYREDKNLTGTPRYCSINTQIGLEQSRRDDMESIMYILIYLHTKKLPWMGCGKGKNRKDKNKLILRKKQTMSIANLCTGLPDIFPVVLKEIRMLKFSQKPSYERYIKLFKQHLETHYM